MLALPSIVVAQDVKVVVLDALSGKPQPGVSVVYLCTPIKYESARTPSIPTKTSTNSEGIAIVHYGCKDDEEIYISTAPPSPKEQCGTVDTLTLNEIALKGVISPPDGPGGLWCPTKKSKLMKPMPEQVIIFVKKPTWFQSHIAG